MAIKNDLPTVIISNIAETFAQFLGQADNPTERENLIKGEAYTGDRTLLWAGDPKLVFVSYPVMHAELITHRLNYPGTSFLAPQNPTPYLCNDILREETLLNNLIKYAGKELTIRLIPYATTPEFIQLVEILRVTHKLKVITPESPDANHLWIRDYIDTKAGFRQLVSTWLPDADNMLPFGITCYTPAQAAQVAQWFCIRGETCVAKANSGENGIGINEFKAESHPSLQYIREQISNNSFFASEPIIVERRISSAKQISPSLEFSVPPLGEGEPKITYLSNQLFLKFGDFCGVEVSKQLYDQPWYPDLERSGLIIAKRLQELGYVGPFDLDCIVGDNNRVYLLEINSRRTGGTHVHDFAYHTFGPDYIEKISLLSFGAMESGCIRTSSELIDVVKEYLYPLNGNSLYGLVITNTTMLLNGHFGCITIAPSVQQAVELQEKVLQKIQEYCAEGTK